MQRRRKPYDRAEAEQAPIREVGVLADRPCVFRDTMTKRTAERLSRKEQRDVARAGSYVRRHCRIEISAPLVPRYCSLPRAPAALSVSR